MTRRVLTRAGLVPVERRRQLPRISRQLVPTSSAYGSVVKIDMAPSRALADEVSSLLRHGPIRFPHALISDDAGAR